MSKAFTKDDTGRCGAGRYRSGRPGAPGAVNYLTAEGHARFTAELSALNDKSGRDDADDRRRRWLTRVLEISRPIDAVLLNGNQVRFGATVVVRGTDDSTAVERTYRIVGIHEADAARGQISWNSPLARALLGAARATYAF